MPPMVPTHISVHATEQIAVPSDAASARWRPYHIANRYCLYLEIQIRESGRVIYVGYDEQEVQKGNYIRLISPASAIDTGQNKYFHRMVNPQEVWFQVPLDALGACTVVFVEYYVRESEFEAYKKEMRC